VCTDALHVGPSDAPAKSVKFALLQYQLQMLSTNGERKRGLDLVKSG
jgi:hypothetical protein